MWRSILAHPRKGSLKLIQYRHSSSSSEGSRKLLSVGSFVLSAGLGFTGAIVYGNYDPNFKKILQDNIPYVKQIYKWLPSEEVAEKPVKDSLSEKKVKDSEALSSSLLKKKLDREKASIAITEVPKPPIEPKSTSSVTKYSKDDKNLSDSNAIKTESTVNELLLEDSHKKEELASNESILNETLQRLNKSTTDALNAQKSAVNAVKLHTEKLYEALELPEGKDGDLLWKEAKEAVRTKEKAVNIAKEKAAETKFFIEKAKKDIKKIDPGSRLNKNAEESVSQCIAELLKAESEVAAAEIEAKSAAEYQNLVNTSKEQFRKELEIVLPNYLHDKDMNEGDLNLLIAHAHRRIEQLQRKIAKQQVTEKLRVDEAVHSQRMQDEQITESRIQAEMKKRHLDFESAIENRVSSLKAKFEADLHQQLLRQAAAHADHLKEVLKVQEQELARKHTLDSEEKLLHQKGVFISEVSGNMARIKGILDFLKAKSEFDKSSKTSQAMWLACEAMFSKINLEKVENTHLNRTPPLAKDIASIKIAADDRSEFIESVLSSIPADAVQTGVFPAGVLKERFLKVKKICQKVALIDENNDSLFRYLLSYLQSLLIIDAVSIPKGELEGKVAVDPSEWDTFDILNRISYCLQINDMNQALRYANQLKGEPKSVAKDWINEVKLLVETQLAVKALLAHAAAVGVQAYH